MKANCDHDLSISSRFNIIEEKRRGSVSYETNYSNGWNNINLLRV